MPTKSEAKQARIRELKKEASSIKSRLIDLQRKLEEESAREAESLGRVIGRLEAWQNR